jgi:hypothetical protein
MGTQHGAAVLVATEEGLHLIQATGAVRVDALAAREVVALAADRERRWAIADGRELWASTAGVEWELLAKLPRGKATCLAATPAGLLVGTVRAHLLRLDGGRLASIRSFDEAEGRAAWHTPWGAPADTRSISAGEGAIYVNVHVGGVLRSTDRSASWRPLLDIEHDVHQVLAPAAHPGLVLVAAYDGFGVSEDRGDTWRWDNDGLHSHYCRAVAVAGDMVLLSASAGHHGRRAALYRRPLAVRAPFERCRDGLPDWFPDNVDTGCLVARGRTVALGSADGTVFLSCDAGRRWETIAKGLAPVRALAFA